MRVYALTMFFCILAAASAWSLPYYPGPQGPIRLTRFAPPPPYRIPVRPVNPEEIQRQQRPKRNHDDDFEDFDHDHHLDDHHDSHHDRHRNRHHHDSDDKGVTGPVHTFVKTDKNANYKWGVRHHVGNKFAS